MARVAVYTVGCKVNQAESGTLKSALAESGHFVVADAADADLCVVNTCTVTAESDRKCRKLLRSLHKRGATSLVAAGCYAEVSPHDLEGLPGVVKVIPNSRKDGWLAEVLALLPDGRGAEAGERPRRSRAFIKVQDGCERSCSYCIAPSARGLERSYPSAEVLPVLLGHLAAGTEEVVLCGVNLGRYNVGPGLDLASLVREVLGAGDGFRVRLSSIELEDLCMDWVEEWSREPRICPHLHLPLQSGDTDILRDMGRGYGAEDYLAAVDAVRAAWPRAAFTTEVIVGYPGESDAAFQHTVEALRQVRPSRVHVFRFSPRPGTAAWSRGGRVDAKGMEERSAALRELAEAWRLEYIDGRIGERRDLLVESIVSADGTRAALGTTEDYMKGILPAPPPGAVPGRILRVRIDGVMDGKALLEAVTA